MLHNMSRDEKFRGALPSGRNTDELMKRIAGSTNVAQTMEELKDDMNAPAFNQRLSALMEERGLNASRLAEQSMMSRSFVYQLCNGEREPGRDIVIRLSLLLKTGVQEARKLLRSAGRGDLYPRNRRDAILIYALKEGLDVAAADELLRAYGEAPLIKV